MTALELKEKFENQGNSDTGASFWLFTKLTKFEAWANKKLDTYIKWCDKYFTTEGVLLVGMHGCMLVSFISFLLWASGNIN